MNKPRVKLVPHKEVKDVLLPEFVSFDGQNLKLLLDSETFQPGETFDAIIEEGNQLKFLKTSLQGQEDKYFSFGVFSFRDVIKREYERISLILDVVSQHCSAQTINISAGGMQIRSEQSLEEGAIYDFDIKYDSKSVQVKYEVLRVKKNKNKFLISGRFIDLDKDVKAFIIQQNLKIKIFSLKSLPMRKEEEEALNV